MRVKGRRKKSIYNNPTKKHRALRVVTNHLTDKDMDLMKWREVIPDACSSYDY